MTVTGFLSSKVGKGLVGQSIEYYLYDAASSDMSDQKRAMKIKGARKKEEKRKKKKEIEREEEEKKKKRMMMEKNRKAGFFPEYFYGCSSILQSAGEILLLFFLSLLLSVLSCLFLSVSLSLSFQNLPGREPDRRMDGNMITYA